MRQPAPYAPGLFGSLQQAYLQYNELERQDRQEQLQRQQLEMQKQQADFQNKVNTLKMKQIEQELAPISVKLSTADSLKTAADLGFVSQGVVDDYHKKLLQSIETPAQAQLFNRAVGMYTNAGKPIMAGPYADPEKAIPPVDRSVPELSVSLQPREYDLWAKTAGGDKAFERQLKLQDMRDRAAEERARITAGGRASQFGISEQRRDDQFRAQLEKDVRSQVMGAMKIPDTLGPALSRVKEVLETGDPGQIQGVLGNLAKTVGGDSGALSNYDTANALQQTLGGQIAIWERWLGGENVKIPEAQLRGIYANIDIFERNMKTVAANRINAIEQDFSKSVAYEKIPAYGKSAFQSARKRLGVSGEQGGVPLEQKIAVKRKADGVKGRILEKDFNPNIYEKI